MKKLLSLVLIVIGVGFSVNSQCTNNNTFALDATPPCPGTQTISNVSGGSFYTVNVVVGNIYTFSTCGNTAFDTQITVLNGATVVGYNDDACGAQSEVTWTATFTGTVNVLIDQWPCLNSGTGAELVVQCELPVQTGNGCNTDITICTPGQAGPFGFSTPGNPVGSCLDWIGLTYGYIVLYITQSGPLQMLIDGDATTGFLDVAIFDIPSGQDPCVAIENPANEISCNYADFSNGCNEIGSYFPCTSEVPSPNVVAGDVIMIVVENWSNASTTFTMNLAPPPAAQTGPPDPTITPVGPFCSTDGAVQLTAVDMGGTWTGTATTTDGVFNPTTAGVGTYMIDYAIGSGPCLATSQTSINVIDCSAPCYFDYISSNTSACQTGSVFTVDGQFSYQDNPGTGQVIVEITNSSGTWTQTFNPPFVDGQLYNYNIAGLTADGSPAVITIYFTNDPACEITQNITSPAACNCPADIGTFTVTTDGNQVGNNITLCFGDLLDIETNNDWVAPGLANNPPGPVYDPGVSWLIYSCPPTVALVPDLVQTVPDDPCILGVVSDFDLNEINDQFWIDAYPPGTFANNIVYFVPITMYSIADGTYSYVNTSMPCYEMGPAYAVQYLPEIDATPTENCAAGTVSVVVSGGLPAINGSNFTGQNLVPATASFTTGTAPNGGTIVVGGLQDGDNYSFDIVDANGCPVTITGTFVGGQDAGFSYPQNIYCKNATNPLATITGNTGGTFTAAPAGLSINASTGTINLAASTVGTYTVTYTTAGPVCPDSETFTITINPVPTATISGTATVCNGAPQPTITFTGANGTAPYTFTYNINGGANQTVTSVGTTATVSAPTGTNGTFTYNLVSVQDASATGCSQSQVGSATITVSPLPTATIAGNATVCVGAAQPVVTFTGANGTAPYTFTYNINGGANQTINSVGATATINVSTATNGTFTYNLISVASAAPGSCSQAQVGAVTVTVNPLPTATISGTASVCVGAPQPTITFTGASGTAPYTFSYNINGGATQTITSVGTTATINVSTATAGTFTYNLLSVQDASSTACSQAQAGAATITVNPNPVPVITGASQYCTGQSSTLSTTVAYATYNWSNGDNTPTTDVTIADNPITVTVTTAAGCTATSPAFVVTENSVLVYDETITICQGESALIHGNSETVAGVYSQTFTLPSGCDSTSNITLVVNALPNVNAGLDQEVCTGVQTTLTASGAVSYSWDNGVTNGIGFTQAVGTVTYTVTGTDANGCENTDQVDIVVNPLPIVNAGTDQFVCSGEPVTLSGAGAATYVWNNGVTDGLAFNPAVGIVTYTVTGTDGNGCVNTDQVDVTVYALPNVVAGLDQEVCEGVQVSLNGSGASTYVWDNGVTDGVAFTQPVGTVIYTVTGTDVNNCENTDQVEVVVNPLPVVNAGADQVVCAGDQVVLSGSGASTYLWNNGVVNNTGFNPGVGTTTYTVTGTDANGCVDTDQVDVTVNPLPTATISGTNEVCINGVDQTITFTGASGTAPYTFTYTLNGGAPQTVTSTGNTATVSMTPSSVGTFTYSLVSVEDASATACSQAQAGSAVITVNGLPNVFAGNDLTVCDDETVVLTGSGASTYVWDNGVTNGIGFTPAGTTTYTVTGTDANGCVNSDDVTVTISPNPVVSFVADVTSGCAPLTVTFTNTTPGTLDDCVWNFGNGSTATGCGSVTVTFEQPGLFDVSLTTTNDDGCVGSATYADYIYVEAVPVASFTPSSTVISVLNAQVQFDNTSTNATNYQWDFGDESPVSNEESPIHTFPNVEPGNYVVELIATSPLGCADTAVRVIIVNEELIFYVPNTFTPDGDDYNEYFQPVFTSGYDPFDFNLYIFNRWGELIWESHDASVGWDGTYGVGRGILVQDGTYTWKIDFKTSENDERMEVVGHVNVIR